MRIIQVTENEIKFDNGKSITYQHCPDCCEYNYADFSTLTPDVIGYDHDFNARLKFKWIGQGGNEAAGFTFGDNQRKIFIPCYSDQNGYYSTDLDIIYDGKVVVSGDCQEITSY